MKRGQFLLLGIFFGCMLHAQRILPMGEVVDFGTVNAMVVHDGQLVIGGGFTSILGHLRKNLHGWEGVDF